MYEVGSDQLGEEGWEDVCKEDDAFGYGGADEIEGCGENDNVGDIIDETYRCVSTCAAMGRVWKYAVPNNQNATTTEVSAPWKRAPNLALYMAHDEPGDPGIGRSPEDEGVLDIAVPYAM